MMNQENLIIGVLMEESETISSTELCAKYNIPQEVITEMLEHGFFPHHITRFEQLSLNRNELQRLESAFRLHRDLGINLAGVVLVLELIEQIQQKENELNILRKFFD